MNPCRVAVALLVILVALVPSTALAQQPRDEAGARFEFGGNIVVDNEARLEFLLAADASVRIDGEIDGSVVLLGSDTVVNGRVDGHVIAAGGTLRLTDSAVITGDLSYNNTVVTIDSGAVVLGSTRDDLAVGFSRDLTRFMAWLALANWAGTTLLALVAGLVFAGVGGRQLRESAAAVTSKPLQSILAIVAFWLICTLMIAMLFISVLGIPIAVVLILVLVALWLLGYIVAGTRIGAALTRRRMDNPEEQHPYLPALTGITVLQTLALIPVIITLLLSLAAIDDATTLTPANVMALAAYWSISTLLWAIGMLGSGALVYRAVMAWTSSDRSSNSGVEQHQATQI